MKDIDNSAYGLKLFKGLFSDSNKDKSIIMYNIPPAKDSFTNSENKTCNKMDGHIDNVLDSFGLQFNYEYTDLRFKGSDHKAVLVTLLDAKPIYKIEDLRSELTKKISTPVNPPLKKRK